MPLEDLLARCEDLAEDVELTAVQEWKERNPGGKAVGFLPTYVPRELLHAAGVLPVAVFGGGDRLEIVKGDAYFQSYICHLPRSVVELGLSGRLDVLDGMIFPSICDVIRNLSGIWKLEFEGKYARYFDVPQNFDSEIGGTFYKGVLREILADMGKLAGTNPTDDDLRASIRLYNANRRLIEELHDLRAAEPWRAPASEAYLVVRAGGSMPVEEHTELLQTYLQLVRDSDRKPVDDARVVITGAFCEQPPIGLLRTLERSGCAVVDDDLQLAARWLGDTVSEEGDPIEALSSAYLSYDGQTASRYCRDGEKKGARLLETVRRRGAEGVIFAAPSFCDPALLDRPMLQAALSSAGVSCTSFKYSENTGQMQPIREQAGTFADTIKLWGDDE
jgi:benzoyl-CoA reductase subunit C